MLLELVPLANMLNLIHVYSSQMWPRLKICKDIEYFIYLNISTFFHLLLTYYFHMHISLIVLL